MSCVDFIMVSSKKSLNSTFLQDENSTPRCVYIHKCHSRHAFTALWAWLTGDRAHSTVQLLDQDSFTPDAVLCRAARGDSKVCPPPLAPMKFMVSVTGHLG